jgi:hypothetical protein
VERLRAEIKALRSRGVNRAASRTYAGITTFRSDRPPGSASWPPLREGTLAPIVS